MNYSSLLSSEEEEEDGGGVCVSAVSAEIHGFLEKNTRQEVERENLCQHPPHRGLSLGSPNTPACERELQQQQNVNTEAAPS